MRFLRRAALALVSALTLSIGTEAASARPDPCRNGRCDPVAPVTMWSLPAEGATVSGYMFEAANSGASGPCQATASDNVGVTKVLFYVDGVFLNQESLAPYNCKFDTTKVANGAHTLNAVAYDAAGNTSSSTRNVTVDNGAPPPPPPPPVPSPDQPYGEAATIKTWTGAFSDEFDGTSLDTVKWDATWLTGESGYSPPVNQWMKNCFHSSQATVADGALRLGVTTNTNTSCRLRDGSVAPYVGAMVTSYRSASDPVGEGFSTAYGYFESRMRLPYSGGIVNWPAWWTNTSGLNWPEGGEIDIMEELGTGKPCWHYHHEVNGSHQGPGSCISGPDWSGWHTYAVNWEPGKLTFYYDGLQVATWSSNVVSVPHFMILNHAVDGTPFPNTVMEVDYVRVWK